MKFNHPFSIILLTTIMFYSCNQTNIQDANIQNNNKQINDLPTNVLIGKWESFLSERGSYEYDKEFIFNKDKTGVYVDAQSYNSGSRYTTKAIFEIEWELDTVNFEKLTITFKKGKMGGSDFMDEEVKRVINEFSFTNYSNKINFENKNAFNYEIGSRKHRFIKANK